MRIGLTTIQGTIDRRVLVNFRLDPDRVDAILPGRLRSQVVDGYAIGGICLIRLEHIRPDGWPSALGLRSENAAHRIAIEWDDERGRRRRGVYIPRRDTNSRLNTLVGGRLFPGIHHHADFEVQEIEDRIAVSMASRDGDTDITVRARIGDELPVGSVFDTVGQASAFFAQGSLGLSPDGKGHLDALELETLNWSVTPLEVEAVTSAFFDGEARFPAGTAVLDNALLMRGIAHRWHQRAGLPRLPS